ncbi:hypothetical protein HYE55_11180 [Aggregatibacter actinomycetemcomitans]|uniref:hypothetical protein n=1 Tax=Aggregatibacter actinomycetemcomitans TaxID=714 RepID=UPI00197C5FF9|nr:hypothetical protein [Aggregatibacter actinomycetemcomitans]MBN6082583.1 hypothetical protein [Aggregatibacter actinomycetemcomitans]
MHKLLLMVTDAFMLERGTVPYCYFNLSGGFIGAGIDVQWKINNLKNEFSNVEFEITYYNANFCLVTHSENIFINNSTRSLNKGGIIKLNDNDLISLFGYKIRAKIFTNEAEVVTLQDELTYLVNKVTDKTIPNLGYKNDSSFTDAQKGSSNLLTLATNKSNLDPLLELKIDENIQSELINGTYNQAEITDYKFFNPHIEGGLEYYVPSKFNPSSDKFPINSQVTKSDVLLSDGTSSPQKSETKQEEMVLDPLFFIK